MTTETKPKTGLTIASLWRPTFKYPVQIPVPGAEPQTIKFTFINRTKSDFEKWLEELKHKADPEFVMSIVSGWDLDDPFGVENVTLLCGSCHGAAKAISRTYVQQITGTAPEAK